MLASRWRSSSLPAQASRISRVGSWWRNRLCSRRFCRPDRVSLPLPQADDLYELVTERAGRPMIIISNRAPAHWYPLFPNPVVAESILDRRVNSAYHIAMSGRSYRPDSAGSRP